MLYGGMCWASREGVNTARAVSSAAERRLSVVKLSGEAGSYQLLICVVTEVEGLKREQLKGVIRLDSSSHPRR